MTTVSFIVKKCCMCGETSRQAEIGMRDLMEPYDLDTRPTGASRSSIYMWVQCCGSCGYCATDISAEMGDIKSILQSKEYKARLKNPKAPESLNHFICWSMLLEASGEYAQAGQAALYSAWISDDDINAKSFAPGCRAEALRLFEKAQSHGQCFADNSAEEELIKIDLLRRNKQFDQAKKLCELQQALQKDTRSQHILAFEEDLINAQDNGVHTLAEALEDLD